MAFVQNLNFRLSWPCWTKNNAARTWNPTSKAFIFSSTICLFGKVSEIQLEINPQETFTKRPRRRAQEIWINAEKLFVISPNEKMQEIFHLEQWTRVRSWWPSIFRFVWPNFFHHFHLSRGTICECGVAASLSSAKQNWFICIQMKRIFVFLRVPFANSLAHLFLKRRHRSVVTAARWDSVAAKGFRHTLFARKLSSRTSVVACCNWNEQI